MGIFAPALTLQANSILVASLFRRRRYSYRVSVDNFVGEPGCLRPSRQPYWTDKHESRKRTKEVRHEYENCCDWWNWTHRFQSRREVEGAGPGGDRGSTKYGGQHTHRRGARRGSEGRVGGYRRVECPFVGRQRSDEFLRDVNAQPAYSGNECRRATSRCVVGCRN